MWYHKKLFLMAKAKINYDNLLTYADLTEDIFSGFKNDKERIKYMSKAYKDMGVAKSFAVFYGMDFEIPIKTNKMINNITVIKVGQIYTGTVKEFNKNTIVFDIPGVKEEIYSKENLTGCYDAIQNYLLTHDNKLSFEVREKKDNRYVVSVINAYYRIWHDRINRCIQNEDGIQVHIDDLVKGGYVCHTPITDLVQLTGQNYTSSVFIPGSHIVLNIENDFEKWIGSDVIIVPQKFVQFKTDFKTGLIENSLVGSRKRVLQIYGMQNMYDIYSDVVTKMKLAEANESVIYTPEVFDGTVTGIINSNKKTGIFVELNDKFITGLMPIDVSDLLNYKPGDPVKVKIKEFEIQEGKEPFVLNKKGNKILRCNVRPVFEVA